MIRVPFPQLESELAGMLQTLRFSGEQARLCAQLIAETTCDGVYTHGLARFPRLVAMVKAGLVDPAAHPTKTLAFGAMERWDGNRGAGNLNARFAMERAIALARQHGIGAVFLANTNHWMRGGTYAWQAAAAGCLSVCFTNTMANLPPWGANTVALGNNPLVMGVPRGSGEHVVLDMAMSQYSFGTLDSYVQRGEPLPFPGGFDTAGKLTTDAATIKASGRALPIGLWKGSGLALMLDLFAATLTGGNATHQIPADPHRESGVSQVFVAINPAYMGQSADFASAVEAIVSNLHEVAPSDPGNPVRYPGEKTIALRRENLDLGVPVDEALWKQLQDRSY